jgi:hypothetical protein
MPASLIAAATCASAPGVFSMSMTRSTAMCPPGVSVCRRGGVALAGRSRATPRAHSAELGWSAR